MSTAVEVHYTPDEYLALERKAEFKSEYIDGRIYPMHGPRGPLPGASGPHSDILINLIRVISTWLLDRPGRVYSSDMRLLVGPTGRYTYPDVMAVVGKPSFEDDASDTLLNPAVIVEVLSPSTEAYDRGEKFASYRRLDSLQEYVLVAQDRVLVERFARRGAEWLLTEFGGLDDVLRLESIGCDVPLREVYAKTPLIAEAGPQAG